MVVGDFENDKERDSVGENGDLVKAVVRLRVRLRVMVGSPEVECVGVFAVFVGEYSTDGVTDCEWGALDSVLDSDPEFLVGDNIDVCVPMTFDTVREAVRTVTLTCPEILPSVIVSVSDVDLIERVGAFERDSDDVEDGDGVGGGVMVSVPVMDLLWDGMDVALRVSVVECDKVRVSVTSLVPEKVFDKERENEAVVVLLGVMRSVADCEVALLSVKVTERVPDATMDSLLRVSDCDFVMLCCMDGVILVADPDPVADSDALTWSDPDAEYRFSDAVPLKETVPDSVIVRSCFERDDEYDSVKVFVSDIVTDIDADVELDAVWVVTGVSVCWRVSVTDFVEVTSAFEREIDEVGVTVSVSVMLCSGDSECGVCVGDMVTVSDTLTISAERLRDADGVGVRFDIVNVTCIEMLSADEDKVAVGAEGVFVKESVSVSVAVVDTENDGDA